MHCSAEDSGDGPIRRQDFRLLQNRKSGLFLLVGRVAVRISSSSFAMVISRRDSSVLTASTFCITIALSMRSLLFSQSTSLHRSPSSSLTRNPKHTATCDIVRNGSANSATSLWNCFTVRFRGLRGEITPRYSRDLCAKERARKKREHHIVRFEVWIQCSCGFKGRSHNHACPKCKTEVPFPWQSAFPL